MENLLYSLLVVVAIVIVSGVISLLASKKLKKEQNSFIRTVFATKLTNTDISIEQAVNNLQHCKSFVDLIDKEQLTK